MGVIRMTAISATVAALWCAAAAGGASPARITRDQAIARMKPYTGPSVRGVDASTLTGKVMCGYQGWFGTPGDGTGRGWVHYGAGRRLEPGRCTFDLWPDTSEMGADEKCPTAFRHADGSTAYLFSSANRKTVLRHFKWMRDYGIDGVFVQRFGVSVRSARGLDVRNTVTAHCRQGANLHGRTYAMMYDLSGLQAGEVRRVVMADWKLLVDRMKVRTDEAYARHAGKPVVAVWGVGFSDNRRYTLAECAELVDFLANDPKYGRNTVMLGVPFWWRTLQRDAVGDKALHAVIRKAHIVSPWSVGRYRTPKEASAHAREAWVGDIAWCRRSGLEFMPVVFPGFSWQNLMKARGQRAKLDQIPRLKGRFLQQQYDNARAIGATMVYQAMFDEIDEGTAIFKCTNTPPVGASKFLTYEGLPADHYLRLVGKATLMIRNSAKERASRPDDGALRSSGIAVDQVSAQVRGESSSSSS